MSFTLLFFSCSPCCISSISHVNNLFVLPWCVCFLDSLPVTLPNESSLPIFNPTLCSSSSSPLVVCCGLLQIVSPPAHDQVVVQRCSIWIMMCWITPNLVMDVLLPLWGASMDGWNFIRFHSALPYNLLKLLSLFACVASCVCVVDLISFNLFSSLYLFL